MENLLFCPAQVYNPVYFTATAGVLSLTALCETLLEPELMTTL